MENLLVRLRRGDIVLGDGAWGTQLFERGLPPGTPPESWTLERPDVLLDIAREYLAAGAEIITTNTFGGSPLRLRQHDLQDRTDEINRRGVEIAREAAGDRAWVAASVGPVGRILRPLGDADPDEVRDGFRRQILAQARAGADLICIETMMDIEEARLAIEAAKAAAPSIPIMATMTFDITPRGPFTVMGASVARAAAALQQAGADIVGSNCGTGVEGMIAVAAELVRVTRLPIAIQPNAGLPERVGGRLVYPDTPESFARKAAPLLDGRISIVGGCCGTTPAHIRALAGQP
jgi:5-methyltetrahydrofolate--homocysteine methyltransferase